MQHERASLDRRHTACCRARRTRRRRAALCTVRTDTRRTSTSGRKGRTRREKSTYSRLSIVRAVCVSSDSILLLFVVRRTHLARPLASLHQCHRQSRLVVVVRVSPRNPLACSSFEQLVGTRVSVSRRSARSFSGLAFDGNSRAECVRVQRWLAGDDTYVNV
jgi:hypothetical protein